MIEIDVQEIDKNARIAMVDIVEGDKVANIEIEFTVVDRVVAVEKTAYNETARIELDISLRQAIAEILQRRLKDSELDIIERDSTEINKDYLLH